MRAFFSQPIVMGTAAAIAHAGDADDGDSGGQRKDGEEGADSPFAEHPRAGAELTGTIAEGGTLDKLPKILVPAHVVVNLNRGPCFYSGFAFDSNPRKPERETATMTSKHAARGHTAIDFRFTFLAEPQGNRNRQKPANQPAIKPIGMRPRGPFLGSLLCFWVRTTARQPGNG
jgi:hypothetical protein